MFQALAVFGRVLHMLDEATSQEKELKAEIECLQEEAKALRIELQNEQDHNTNTMIKSQ